MFVKRSEYERMKKEIEELKQEKEDTERFFIDPTATFKAEFSNGSSKGTLQIGDTKCPVYIGSIERKIEVNSSGYKCVGYRWTLIGY